MIGVRSTAGIVALALDVLTTEAADLRRALAQAEHERDEALAEATRLADILTNCGYWG